MCAYIQKNFEKCKNILPVRWEGQLNEYLNNKKWVLDVVDIVPSVVADMLNVNLNVFREIGEKVKRSNFNECGSRCINVLLTNGHYEGVEAEIFWSDDSNDLKGSIGERKRDGSDRSKGGNRINYCRPTIVLEFMSEKMTCEWNQFKSRLSIEKEFNIMYKSGKKLSLIAKMANNRKERREEKENTSSDGDRIGVVYSATCRLCKENRDEIMQYIGEMGRMLDERLGEHCKKCDIHDPDDSSVSAIVAHSVREHGLQPDLKDWGIQILDSNLRMQGRKLLEALWIFRKKPRLNRDTSVKIIMKNVKF